MSVRSVVCCLAPWLCGLIPVVAAADEVVTTNGNRLTGNIIRADEAEVVLRTEYAGVIIIEQAKVRSLSRGPQSSAAQAPVAAAAVPAAVDPQPVAAPTASSPEPSLYAAEGAFSGGVNFALSSEAGNSDKDEIDLDYNLQYRRGWNRFRSFGTLEHDTNAGEKTKDKWSTFNQYSRLFPSRWFGGAWFTFEHDRFSDLRLRTMGGPTVGYLFAEGDAFNLIAEAGPAVLGEDYYNQSDREFAGGAWFLSYDQLVWQDRIQPYHRQFGFVGLDGESKVLWQSWTGLRVPLAGGFTGSVEFEYDYDSNPAMDAKTTDTTWRFKLGYQW
jgi:putative salt-induced outer membrane protein YdiY